MISPLAPASDEASDGNRASPAQPDGAPHRFSPELGELAVAIGQLLRARGATVATAESCTGGLVGALLTTVPGSSDYYLGGVISYANSVKERLLGVSPETLAQDGAVSRRCVEEMARGARRLLGSTYAIAVSGVAGPGGGTPAKPVGTVHFAVSSPTGERTQQILYPGDREAIREVSVLTVLRLLAAVVRQESAAEGPR